MKFLNSVKHSQAIMFRVKMKVNFYDLPQMSALTRRLRIKLHKLLWKKPFKSIATIK